MIHMYAIKNIQNKYQNYEYINLFFVEYDCSMPDINSFFLYSMGKNLKHVPVIVLQSCETAIGKYTLLIKKTFRSMPRANKRSKIN